MPKLGYTWYPKDWGNSESVFELNLSERGLYRELIDLAMLNDNKTEIKLDVWSRKFAIDSDALKLILSKLLLLNLIQINKGSNSEILFIPSCESRLKLVRGGRNGGKISKPTIKPIIKPFESLLKNNEKPIANQIENKDKVNKNEIENKIENNNFIFYTDLLNSQQWLESLAINNKNKFKLVQVKQKLLEFKNDLDLKFDIKVNKNEFASHFVSWLNLQKNNSVKPFFDSPA
jgi:hypothetical protein